MDQEELNKLTDAVISKIKEKYILVEKTFNLDTYNSEERKAKEVAYKTFIDNITNIACAYYNLNKDKLMLQAQTKIKSEFYKVVWAVGHLCKEIPESAISQRVIGEFFNKNHATVYHWQALAEAKIEKNFEFKYEVNEIKKLVEQSLKIY
jgi:chromosomal replication initiation ATPase DnaA